MKNRKYFKFGYSLMYLIPVFAILLSFLGLMIISGSIIGIIILLFLIFIASTLHLRWAVYFSDNYICTFYLLEGKKHIPYSDVVEISYKTKLAGGSPSVVSIYFIKNGKVRFAKFEVGTFYYIPEILNFIQNKVNSEVIKEQGFMKAGLKKNENRYEY